MKIGNTMLWITIILMWILLVPFAQITDIRDNFLQDEYKTFWYYLFQNFIEAGMFTFGLLIGYELRRLERFKSERKRPEG